MIELSIKCINSEKLDSGSYYGKFVIDSLKPGQGLTIGNQLRRVLLSDLGKKAITAVSIVGINHEYSIIPGVREDILEILLNLKGIVLSSTSKNVEFAKLKIQGPAVVTADSIELTSNSKIINPHHYIATISENIIVQFDFKIEYGTGYKLTNQLSSSKENNFLSIDALFMPVRKVDFHIDTFYKKNNNVRERLYLEIWTDGSIRPTEAIKLASKNIITLFRSLIRNKPKRLKKNTDLSGFDSYKNISIEELALSVRPYNCLKKAQINTLGDLLQYSPEKLLKLRNFGKKSVNEVSSTLKNKFNLTL